MRSVAPDRQRREPQPLGPHRGAGQRQHRVDADGPQQRALARHVRAGDDQHARVAAEATRRSARAA